ncbi:hypothetical protein [Candidatus Williamhamiltonella defendens]|uniref:hypothetical protein n=1 Tax=Candidatus Williamhamiltonella defendens TaxID=138072 RepID=UPI0016519637|nr:hypothetical protein [Candidatus Hamiltonella defensa]
MTLIPEWEVMFAKHLLEVYRFSSREENLLSVVNNTTDLTDTYDDLKDLIDQ